MIDGWLSRIATAAVVAMLLAAAVASVVNPTTDAAVAAGPAPVPAGAGGDAERLDTSSGLPVLSLDIPALELDEDLIELGIDDEHRLEVPDEPERVGWFTEGAGPGEIGPTVVVGHLDSNEGPAVFARLPELTPGDEMTLTDDAGAAVRYRVVETEDVPKDRFPTWAVYDSSAQDTLRLITCTGPWDPTEGAHRDNRIVYAEAIEPAADDAT